MVLEFGVTEEVMQELRDERDLENGTPRVPKIDNNLHDWEKTLVLADALVVTKCQSKSGLKSLWARQVGGV